ncbi:MAG TPA: sortase, partial [Anaerolineae bacterium]|nr:sortase [Anaerolineae bacterium]
PELQPLASPPARGRQIFSSMLIIAGFALLATGGWMFIQYQLEASKPPPARILEVSVVDLTETPTPRPKPTQTVPPTARPSRLGDTVLLEPTQTPLVQLEASSPVTPTLYVTPTPTPQEIVPTPESLPTDPPLSLEDNPLIVEEPLATPAAVESAPAPAEAAMPSPITRIVAESIGLDAQVIGVGWIQEIRSGVPTNIWTVADYAAGWHKNTALPGQGGNIVLSGHHNIKGEVFRYTIDLNVGDMVTLYMGDQPYYYTGVDKFIVKDKDEPDAVRRENAKWIGPFNEERLTLVTCWPYTNNTHRAIVIAKPVQH